MRTLRLRTACCSAALAAALVLPSTPASGAPEAPSAGVGTLLKRMHTLYARAEKAAEDYDAAAQALKEQRGEVKRTDRRLARARGAVGKARRQAAVIAREQYQGATGLSPYLELLLARSPQAALDRTRVIRRVSADQAGLLERLTTDRKRLGALAAASRKALDRQRALAGRQRAKRTQAKHRLAEVERALAALSAEQLAELDRIDVAGADDAQRDLVDSGALGDGKGGAKGGRRARTPEVAAKAVSYAIDQIGKPYHWGAAGPRSFDSSGLTAAAWRRAGFTLPHSGRQQWKRLPHVPLRRLRPGDVVVYRPAAAHVALYLGRGKVVEAAVAARKVRVAPIAVRPVLGAVRPDGRFRTDRRSAGGGGR